MAKNQLHDGNDEGTVLGSATTDLVGFHGTVADQAAAITLASAATHGTTRTAVQNILIALREKGFIAS